MKKRLLIATALLLIGLAVAVGVALAQVSANYDLSWHVVAGGGARSTSANYIALGTIGQPAIGMVSSAAYQADIGFWYRFHLVYLPLVLRTF